MSLSCGERTAAVCCVNKCCNTAERIVHGLALCEYHYDMLRDYFAQEFAARRVRHG